MLDEILGAGTFIILFVGGLVIYDVIEKWQVRKASKQKNANPQMCHS